MVKNPEIDNNFLEALIHKLYAFEHLRQGFKMPINDCRARLQTDILTDSIMARHQVEPLQPPEKISEALENCKEQMLVRDNHKPEHFIWELKLREDPQEFGFLKQFAKNRLTKHRIELIFTKASDLFYSYFKARISVVSTDLSGLVRKRD